jgi:hypothetical protein
MEIAREVIRASLLPVAHWYQGIKRVGRTQNSLGIIRVSVVALRFPQGAPIGSGRPI